MTIITQLDWTQNLQFIGRSNNGPAVVLDNPEGGSGLTPMQYVLMGIAGCMAMDVVSILKKKRASLTAVQVNSQGDRAQDHPKRFTEVRIEFVITGTGVKPSDVERAIELSDTKYCSAIASVNAQVTHTFKIVDSSGPGKK
ncbi:MAG: OsmC family protein [Desulfobacteraceae bacterium]|nr:OsmC family protein [Desulfobacteraceae bacterium]